jgi:sialic acid synthase SpsE
MAYVIAELATNHGGDVDLACRMVDEAARCGAAVVKVQAYDIATLRPDDHQYDWFLRAALSDAALARIASACRESGVTLLATVFDPGRVPVVRQITPWLKIGSGEWRDAALWAAVEAAAADRVFVSLGLCPEAAPRLPEAYVPLACVTQYPAPEWVAALAIARIGRGGPWGYSDHTLSPFAIELALALGAEWIELHVALAGTARRLACDRSADELRRVCAIAREGPIPLVEDARRGQALAARRFEGRWWHGR